MVGFDLIDNKVRYGLSIEVSDEKKLEVMLACPRLRDIPFILKTRAVQAERQKIWIASKAVLEETLPDQVPTWCTRHSASNSCAVVNMTLDTRTN